MRFAYCALRSRGYWIARFCRRQQHHESKIGNATLPRRHADRAVEPDHFAVEIAVLDDVQNEVGKLLGPAEHLWKRDCGRKRVLHLMRQPVHHRGAEQPGCDRSEEHTSELQSPDHLVCRLLLEKKKEHMTIISS